MKFHPKHVAVVLGVLMLLLAFVPPAHAKVSIEYSGPYPLRPTPVPGKDLTLSATFMVGNVGDEPTNIMMTPYSNQTDFFTYFNVTLSDNNFTLQNPPSTNPGDSSVCPNTCRKYITVTYVFSPDTPNTLDWTSHVYIVASALSYPPGSSPGHATWDSLSVISGSVVPEFPTTSSLVLVLTLLIAFGVLRTVKRRRPRLIN